MGNNNKPERLTWFLYLSYIKGDFRNIKEKIQVRHSEHPRNKTLPERGQKSIQFRFDFKSLETEVKQFYLKKMFYKSRDKQWENENHYTTVLQHLLLTIFALFSFYFPYFLL